MLLVDSSVWIAYFNGVVSAETSFLRSQVARREIVVGDIVLAEVLRGFDRDADFDTARFALRRFQQVTMLNPQLAVESAQYYRALRKRGITIRKTIDCFIATFAIAHRHELLHDDGDFLPFEMHLGLRAIHP